MLNKMADILRHKQDGFDVRDETTFFFNKFVEIAIMILINGSVSNNNAHLLCENIQA